MAKEHAACRGDSGERTDDAAGFASRRTSEYAAPVDWVTRASRVNLRLASYSGASCEVAPDLDLFNKKLNKEAKLQGVKL